MNETIQQPVPKQRKPLTEAQKAALKKGREALAAKRRLTAQNTMTELTEVSQKEEVEDVDEFAASPDTLNDVCVGLAIVLASYFITFVVCQQL
jgi:hypothetical protein